ncbi:conserved repeat domain-containing protein/fimbrial isopeptide formation D2 domain-containing protein [Pseudoxanthomonas wuyuanensis]|uniref:Conserved repeat domain-containing protein/fimbrial isopeptide formation D2 domain-containing protein n=1 Tax=Pseudoxanthomonas wuyuanensis TaxID=1073196 RepID=A0A286D5X2_9GAMM|nr:isopeptide-forming domain-containing fimbrial protein [Pseudoxanthomonas wuyuanensis]SOD54048.1 conserved repeat domain-containing protein/fimbrial isopeptide formation D2 domain-containing protein [Pseudoxanthomonas wuyuanensis]
MNSTSQHQVAQSNRPGIFPFVLAALAAVGTLVGVPALAQSSVTNVARIANPSGVPCVDADTNPNCERTDNAVVDITPLPIISSSKAAAPASDATVNPGDTITYTVSTTVADGSTTADFQLIDTASAGLTLGTITTQAPEFGGSCAVSGQTLTCALPSGTAVGTYDVSYTATVNANATGTVDNQVAISGGGDPDPLCDPCSTQHTIIPAAVTRAKTSNPASGSSVEVGDTITYTLTLTVAGSATTQLEALQDTLGTGLSFGSIVSQSAEFAGSCAGSGQALTCSLPSGTLPGVYEVVYTATVAAGATGSLSNTVNDCAAIGDTCGTSHEVSAVTVAKSASPADGASVEAGDTVTYTLTYTVTGGASTEAKTANDQLGAGLTFGAVGAISDPAQLSCTGGSPMACTLATGAPAGTYTVEYTATVDANASGSVSNTVTGVDCATAGGCETTHDVSSVTVAKSANPASGASVEAGDTITYTLTYTVTGGASTEAKTANDQLGAGLTFGAIGTISDPTQLSCTGSSPMACTLAAGAPAGSYTVQYTATVDAGAAGNVSNTVTGVDCATAGGCETSHEVSAVTVAKSASPATGASVEAGDTITYTLTFDVTGGASTEAKTANDQLGAGLTFSAVGAISDPTQLSCTGGSPMACTLSAGAPAGSYTVQYTATVDAGATGTVTNSVSGVDCATTGGCTTSHELSSVTVAKSASPATGTSVEAGDTITYTLTFDVTGGVSTEAKTANDQLGTGLTFGAVGAISDPAQLSCTGGSPMTCTLAQGAPAGTYTVQYTATVDAGATGTVTNTVSGVDCATVGACTTTHELSSVTVAKSASPATGASVEAGDTITYTLTYTVSGGASTEAKTANDQLGAGLSFGAVGAISDPGRLSCTGGSPMACTLAAGAPAGTYTVQYTATVDAGATGSVTNTVTGVDCATAGGCETSHNLSSVTVAKSANPANGASVEAGDTITYTLTYNVTGGPSPVAKTATDQLGAGLSFGALGAISDPGQLSCTGGSPMACTLAAGAPAGTYTVQYTATVDANATGIVTNTVSGVDCATAGGCTTTHVLSAVTVAKSANPANGTSVEAGETIGYTLTFTVLDAASSEAKTATDQLGAGLTFGSVGAISDPGQLSCTGGSPMACTLAAGAPAGTYTVQYTATVDASAAGSLTNTVSGVTCATTDGCTTSHDVSAVTVAKSASPASGASVEAGDTITYTLTYNVTGGASAEAKTANDQLGTGLTFGAVGAISDPGQLSCTGASPMACTLAAGAPVGTYTVQYTATVDAGATGSVTNTVSGVDCTTAGGCTTAHDLSSVTVAKSASPASGASVEAGDTITYTLTYTVTGGPSSEAKIANDQLGAGLTFGAVGTISDPGQLSCTGASPMVCTLAQGAPAGSYTVQYTATVDAGATGSVTNTVSGVDCATAGGCTTSHDVSAVTVAKSANPANGTSVEAGDTITYMLTYTVTGGSSPEAKTANDQLGAGLTFGAVGAISDPGQLSCAGGSPMACTLAAGAPAGTYTVEYTATVNAGATGALTNTVSGVTCASAGACTTSHDVSTVTVAKSASPASGASVEAGDTITYTLTYTVTGGASTEAKTANDQLGTGLTFGAIGSISDASRLSCTGASPLVCTLAAGAPAGSYTVQYTATVDAGASGAVTNTVTGVPCTTASGCTTTHDLSSVTVAKSASPATGTSVEAGDTITYTLTYTVTGGASTEAKTANDQLGAGLVFGAVGAISDASRLNCTGSSPMTCTLATGAPAGTYTVQYTATVGADASGAVTNTVGGIDCATAGGCTTSHDISAVTVAKTANPASGTSVEAGDTITYTLTYTVIGGASTEAKTANDQLGAGLTFGAVGAISDPSQLSCTDGSPMACTLAAGAPAGTYTVEYTATVNADATGALTNTVSGVTCAATGSCTTSHDVSTVTVQKTAAPANGSSVEAGDTITYTLTYTVVGGATTEAKTASDQLGAGLTFGAIGTISDASRLSCTGASPLVCTLAAGTPAGTYTVEYTATVNADATGAVTNTVTGVPCAAADGCTTSHDISAVTVAKSANPASGASVEAGDTITYTLTYTVTGGASSEPKPATDQLGAGLTFGAVGTISDAGQLSCTGSVPMVCTLAQGAPAGTYTVEYTAIVNPDAAGTVTNTVSGVDCASADGCTTSHDVSTITVQKSANPASGTPVTAGETITYTLTFVVDGGASTEAKVASDQLGAGLTFGAIGAVSDASQLSCAGASPMTCTLAAGAPAGTYTAEYTATVDMAAVGTVTNTVSGIACATTDGCTTSHDLRASVAVIKTSLPDVGTEVSVGDTLQYTLTATVEHGTTDNEVRLTDTPGAGLTIGALPAGCAAGTGQIVCTLPAGTVPGTYTFVYDATIDASANGSVANVVVATHNSSSIEVTCASCNTQHVVVERPSLRVAKTSSVREARIGDLVRYTVTVENVGATNANNVSLLDTPPAGFTYVEGSLSVVDGDNAATTSGQNPIRFDGLDIAAGQSATLVYLMRVGAGVRPGVHVNQAQAVSSTGTPISNIATAELTLASDPLIDDSLIFGTVFNDRDGDGWQDNAALTGVRVQGGFAAGAYVPNSTSIDRGHGAQPLSDASAPLLHGVDVGAIAARQSEADPVEAHQVVISQRLAEPSFTDDFVLTSDQGVTVRMDADGRTTVQKSGEAAKGLNAAAPTVERRIAQGEGGFVVDYVISNDGIDERGLPGVRIASVEGLLIETDQFGRYHLVGIPGGAASRGRNFILKVDPATLPGGTQMTTDNPLIRRITPGLPVRFDFGAKIPVEEIPGGTRQIDLELGEVIFAPGSAEVHEAYLPVIASITAKLDEYRGGDVVISVDGDGDALAFDRAAAVKAALMQRLPTELVPAVSVSVRTDASDPATRVAGLDGQGALLGTVLFDTDRSDIRPEFAPLLDRIAAYLEQAGGGTVSIVGHADLRASDAYNLALGMRRARAVYEALAARLSPEVRSRVRVEPARNPASTAADSQ